MTFPLASGIVVNKKFSRYGSITYIFDVIDQHEVSARVGFEVDETNVSTVGRCKYTIAGCRT